MNVWTRINSDRELLRAAFLVAFLGAQLFDPLAPIRSHIDEWVAPNGRTERVEHDPEGEQHVDSRCQPSASLVVGLVGA